MHARTHLRRVTLAVVSATALLVPASTQCTTLWLPGLGSAGANAVVRAAARWDPDGAGPSPPVLVVGGGFTFVGSVAANHIASYDAVIGSWSALGAGTNDDVFALATLPNGDLVAAGSFTSAGGVSASCIARWDGTSWSALGSGMSGSTFPSVSALTALPNGDLVAGGDFTVAGSAGALNVARWDGASWWPLGSGANSAVIALAALPNGNVVAGGVFTSPGLRVARWNGASWTPLGSGMNSWVAALTTLPNGDIVAGGGFHTAGGVSASGIARWNGTSWSSLGSGVTYALAPGTVFALATLANGDVAVGGHFSSAGGVSPCAHIARWNGTSWSQPMAGLNNDVHALVVLQNGNLAVGGDFTGVGVTPTRIAEITTTCPASAVVSSTGCTGSAGPNVLTATSLPWIGSTLTSVATGMPAISLALGVSGLLSVSVPLASILPQGLPGCTLLVSPVVVDLYVPAAGSVTTQLAIPNSVALVAQVLHQQVVAIETDAVGNFVALTGTNALMLTIGAF